MRIWPVVAEMVGSHGRCALVTVAAVRGSAPREPGARMVIAPDGGFHGTIGGGELEWRAIGAARDALSRNAPAATLDRFTLGPDLGQCCGGSVRLLTEVFDRDRLDEIRALAAREAAGPFVTCGRIGPRAVERVVIDDAGSEGGETHEAFSPASGDRWRGRLAIPLRGIEGASTNATPAPAERAIGGVVPHERIPVVIEDDGAIVERFRDPPAPALAVRRRPCRPRPDARPRPVALRRHLDRRARGRFSLGGARQRAPVAKRRSRG